MGDFMPDKNERKSIFDSFKFWGHKAKNRNTLSQDIENIPTIKIEDTADDVQPNEKREKSIPSSVKLYETISGNFIITRGWDGNNMQVYKMRRKNY